MKARRLASASARGFTLVELMVALTGGLFVTMAVFILSKQSTSLYQAEARISNATLGGVVGFERLRADIERAGYLVSPNVVRDPKLCGFPNAAWPHAGNGLGQFQQHLSSLFITPTPSASIPAEIAAAGITPDEITLAGAYTSVDQFPTGPIFNDGTHDVVALQIASPPMARLGFSPALPAAQQQLLLSSVFGAGRILRIVDTVGREQYAKILTVNTTSSPPQIVLDNTTGNQLIYRGGTDQTFKCGIQGLGERSVVNVVNLVRYSLRNMSADPKYAPLYDHTATIGTTTTTAGASTDTGRGELIREELDAAGAPINDANGNPIAEVVTEFAVDLAIGLTVSQIVATGGGPPVEKLVTLGAGSTAISAWAGQTWGSAAGAGASSLTAPQFVRAVHVRFGVRSREADRATGMPLFGDGGTTPVMPGLYRIGLGASAGAPFARVRTMQADVMLRNHRGVTWQ